MLIHVFLIPHSLAPSASSLTYSLSHLSLSFLIIFLSFLFHSSTLLYSFMDSQCKRALFFLCSYTKKITSSSLKQTWIEKSITYIGSCLSFFAWEFFLPPLLRFTLCFCSLWWGFGLLVISKLMEKWGQIVAGIEGEWLVVGWLVGWWWGLKVSGQWERWWGC